MRAGDFFRGAVQASGALANTMNTFAGILDDHAKMQAESQLLAFQSQYMAKGQELLRSPEIIQGILDDDPANGQESDLTRWRRAEEELVNGLFDSLGMNSYARNAALGYIRQQRGAGTNQGSPGAGGVANIGAFAEVASRSLEVVRAQHKDVVTAAAARKIMDIPIGPGEDGTGISKALDEINRLSKTEFDTFMGRTGYIRGTREYEAAKEQWNVTMSGAIMENLLTQAEMILADPNGGVEAAAGFIAAVTNSVGGAPNSDAPTDSELLTGAHFTILAQQFLARVEAKQLGARNAFAELQAAGRELGRKTATDLELVRAAGGAGNNVVSFTRVRERDYADWKKNNAGLFTREQLNEIDDKWTVETMRWQTIIMTGEGRGGGSDVNDAQANAYIARFYAQYGQRSDGEYAIEFSRGLYDELLREAQAGRMTYGTVRKIAETLDMMDPSVQAGYNRVVSGALSAVQNDLFKDRSIPESLANYAKTAVRVALNRAYVEGREIDQTVLIPQVKALVSDEMAGRAMSQAMMSYQMMGGVTVGSVGALEFSTVFSEYTKGTYDLFTPVALERFRQTAIVPEFAQALASAPTTAGRQWTHVAWDGKYPVFFAGTAAEFAEAQRRGDGTNIMVGTGVDGERRPTFSQIRVFGQGGRAGVQGGGQRFVSTDIYASARGAQIPAATQETRAIVERVATSGSGAVRTRAELNALLPALPAAAREKIVEMNPVVSARPGQPPVLPEFRRAPGADGSLIPVYDQGNNMVFTRFRVGQSGAEVGASDFITMPLDPSLRAAILERQSAEVRLEWGRLMAGATIPNANERVKIRLPMIGQDGLPVYDANGRLVFSGGRR